MRGARSSIFIAAWALASCFETPDYEGRLCESGDTCPAGLSCGSDGRCHHTTLAFDASTPGPDSGASSDDAALDAASSDAVENGDASADATSDLDSGADASNPDAMPGDTGGPDPARCTSAVGYPTSGWEARTFSLDAADGFTSCLGVEDLSGDPIDRDYASGGPVPGISDRFGTRYTARRTFSAGVETFTFSYDDGVRLYINGALVFEDWRRGQVQQNVVVRSPYLTAGDYQLTIEHYENLGGAQIHARWERGCGTIAPTGTSWNIAYYRLTAGAIDLSECLGVAEEATDRLSLDYGAGPPPIPGLTITDGWAAVGWATRSFHGLTTFTLGHDDGLRFSVDGTAFFDHFASSPADGEPLSLLMSGDHLLSFELAEVSGTAHVSIDWSNYCDTPLSSGATSWVAKYYGVIYDGTVNPPTWTLDLNNCLYQELINTTLLDFDWMGSAPAFLANSENITDLWGAEYTTRRTFGSSTPGTADFDDGIRIYSDSNLLFDNWTAPQVVTGAAFTFPAGTHDLHVFYFENLGFAQLHVHF